MLRFGQKEVDAVAKVVASGKLFRYMKDGHCGRFERRFGKYVGAKHVRMTSSGTVALQAGLIGLGVGPGDEVLVPAHTFIATPLAVLGAGAIPVIVDVDESLLMDPRAMSAAVGPRTRAVIPVHMWGTVCDMNRIMRAARKHKLLVLEDACQCVGGGYKGRMAGSIGHAGAFSFNYYKNMTCGEGGAVVCNDESVFLRAECTVDPCRFYWTGREDFRPFAAVGSRASEFEGAMLNAQLDRLPAMVRRMRKMKKRVLDGTAETGLAAAPCYSLDCECGGTVVYNLPSVEQARRFAKLTGGVVAADTGRHNYTEWDQILDHRGGHHPAFDPFQMPQNRRCRKKYSKGMLPRSLDILGRTVMVNLHPDRTAGEITRLIATLGRAAENVLA